MKIAIDLNDVVRDFSDNFMRTYLLQYNREFDTTDFEMWSHNMDAVFPFKNDVAYKKFKYEDYAYEIFGKCRTCGRSLPVAVDKWLSELAEVESEEPIEVSFVSTMEFGQSIPYTYMFISSLGMQIRDVYLPYDSTTIWDRYDVLVTANPDLIAMKPEGKKVVKIEKEYNGECAADFTYADLQAFIETTDNVTKLF